MDSGKASTEMNTALKDLPSIILVDVLSRLSLKALCRCRCVCKTFVRLTSDHYFTHVRHNKQPPMIMMASSSMKGFKLSLVIDPGEDYDGCKSIFRLDRSSRMQSIVHSSNGLVVIMNSEKIYLCNPLLRDYVKLPRLLESWKKSYIYGFGYTPVTKQYKLISMSASSEGEKAEFAILTLATSGMHTWRQLSITAPFPPQDIEMFNLNGCFQWRYNDSIYVFDIAEERIQLFPILSTADEELPVLVGSSSLSIIHNHYEDMYLWFLKDYYGDNKESWTKVRASNRFLWSKASKLHGNNVDFSSTNSTIRKVIKKIQKMNDDHDDDTTICDAFDYVPSFVRPKDIFCKQK